MTLSVVCAELETASRELLAALEDRSPQYYEHLEARAHLLGQLPAAGDAQWQSATLEDRQRLQSALESGDAIRRHLEHEREHCSRRLCSLGIDQIWCRTTAGEAPETGAGWRG